MTDIYVKEPPTTGKVILKTTHGELDIELWARETPIACRNFIQLCMEGYYDGVVFHRVIKDFLVQTGDPTGTGEGGQSIYSNPKDFPEEIHGRLKFRYRGLLGMANAGRGTYTNGSQFFIVLSRSDFLSGQNTLFGKVAGSTVYNLQRIADVQVDSSDRPIVCPKIESAEVLQNPFDDIKPRCVPRRILLMQEEQDAKPAGKEAIKGVKKKNALSFVESDEEGVDIKIAAAHDVLDDPRLVKEAPVVSEEEEDFEKSAAAKLAAVREKIAAAGKSRSAASASSAPARPAPREEESSESEPEENDALDMTKAAKAKALERRQKIAELQAELRERRGDTDLLREREKQDEGMLTAVQARQQKFAHRKRAKGGHMGDVMGKLKAFTEKIRKVESKPKEEAKVYQPTRQKGKDVEPGTFASIWESGDEEGDEDWLSGSGLKFAVDSTRAYELDERRAQHMEIYDTLKKSESAQLQERLRQETRRKAEKFHTDHFFSRNFDPVRDVEKR